MPLDEFRELLGAVNVLTGTNAAPFLTDWRKRATGRALAVVRPRSTEEVAEVVKICARTQIAIVPQGGNTGQVAGATPDESGRAIVLSTHRLNRIREIDTLNDTITAEAGCILEVLQNAASDRGRLFPLSLGAKGSCTIGGNLSTNAGGTQVLRYGNAREIALGLEVVTPEGDIWNGLHGLRKDNTGYSLRDIYVGSEGTLGIITAVTCRLFPQAKAMRTALIALNNLDNALLFLELSRAEFDASLTAFELISGNCIDLVLQTFPEKRLPFEKGVPSWCVLIEISDYESEIHATERLETVLWRAFEIHLILDAVLATSMKQRDFFWSLREDITLSLAESGFCIKHDISLPVSEMASFIHEADITILNSFPNAKVMAFGHLGDGNIHYNILLPADINSEIILKEKFIQEIIHDLVTASGGSISAEQGIGLLRVEDLARYKDPVALALMGRLKRAFDPAGIMNPHKVLR